MNDITAQEPRPDCRFPLLAPSSAYSRGCRCSGCKSHRREYVVKRRAEKSEAKPKKVREPRPGCQFPTLSSLTSYTRGCRCEQCIRAWRRYLADYRAKRRGLAMGSIALDLHALAAGCARNDDAKILRDAADEIVTLRRDRDEARRKLCRVIAMNRDASSKDIANEFGWDCFPQEGDK